MSIFRRFLVRSMSSVGGMLNWGPFRSVSFARKTLNTINKITGSDILIEDCAISTLESVLLAIFMAEVVNLKMGIMENFTTQANIEVVVSPHNLFQHRHSVAQGRAC